LKTYPESSLRDLAGWLSKDLREPTPRGGIHWSAEGVRRVLAQSARSCDFGHVEEQRLNMAIYQARSCPPIS
jgi:hypothetical protein